MKPAADMRSRMVIRLDGEVFRVIQAEYHAGGGKMHGVVNAKLRNVKTGGMTERRFRQDERFEEVELQRQAMEFLYEDGDLCFFMHPETFEQVALSKESLGPFCRFMEPNQRVDVEFLEGIPLQVHYPESVELRVQTTPEPLHTDDSNVLKNAILENGMEVEVPQFVKDGDLVRIEVETGKYLKRLR
jgi:elongation factor P